MTRLLQEYGWETIKVRNEEEESEGWFGPRLLKLYQENGYDCAYGREKFIEWHEDIQSAAYKAWLVETCTINKFSSGGGDPKPFEVEPLSYFKDRTKIIKYVILQRLTRISEGCISIALLRMRVLSIFP